MSEEQKAAPRRRPPTGGYARGEEQRARIIQAAMKVFGDEGYERASTRMIAKEAGIKPPALQYYFDSKEGLNRACAEAVIQVVKSILVAPLMAAKAVLADPTPEASVEALCDVLDALVEASLFSKEVPERARFSARAQSDDSPAGPILREKISQPLFDICADLVASATNTPLDVYVRLRTNFILCQVSAFHIHRKTTLKNMDWPDFDGPGRQAIKRVLREQTRRSLGFPAMAVETAS